MTRRSVRHLLRHALFLLPPALLAAGSHQAFAQYQTTDPYDPYNRYYKPFTYPVTTNISGSLPNQSRMGEIGAGMRDPGFVESIDGADLFGRGTGRLEGIGEAPSRYYEANAGDTFYADQQKREDKYFEAMREKDRRKRAILMRQYQQMTRKAARKSTTKATAKAKTKAKSKSAQDEERGSAGAEASLLREDPDAVVPRPRVRRPSDLLTPRGGASPGGLLRNRDAHTPTDVLNRSLESAKKPKAGSLDTPGGDAPR